MTSFSIGWTRRTSPEWRHHPSAGTLDQRIQRQESHCRSPRQPRALGIGPRLWQTFLRSGRQYVGRVQVSFNTQPRCLPAAQERPHGAGRRFAQCPCPLAVGGRYDLRTNLHPAGGCAVHRHTQIPENRDRHHLRHPAAHDCRSGTGDQQQHRASRDGVRAILPAAIPRAHRRGVQPQAPARRRVFGLLLLVRPEWTPARRCQDTLGILQEHDVERAFSHFNIYLVKQNYALQ